MHLLLFLSPDWLTFCHMISSLAYIHLFIYLFFLFLSDEGPTLETIDYTIRIGSTPTFLYFDLYLYSAYAAHYVYVNKKKHSVHLPAQRFLAHLQLFQ